MYASSSNFAPVSGAVKDVINGGGDTDSVQIAGAITLTGANLSGMALVEQLTAASSASSFSHSITLNQAQLGTVISTIDLSTNTGNSTSMIDLSGVATTDLTIKGLYYGNNSIASGNGNDKIIISDGVLTNTGGGTSNTLIGGAGADTIISGDGNDVIIGGITQIYSKAAGAAIHLSMQ